MPVTPWRVAWKVNNNLCFKKWFKPFATTANINLNTKKWCIWRWHSSSEEVIETNTSQRHIKIKYPQNCSGLIQEIIGSLYNALDHYWKVNEMDVMITTTILDPRTKKNGIWWLW